MQYFTAQIMVNMSKQCSCNNLCRWQTKKQRWCQACRPQAVWCLHKHATFKEIKKKKSRWNQNRSKSKYPSVRFLPLLQNYLPLVCRLCLFMLGGRFMIRLVTCACTCKRRARAQRDLFPPHQHSDNTEKPICSAATSRKKEHEQ